MSLEPANPSAATEPDPDRGRAVSLFRFLRDLTELRAHSVRTVDEYATHGKVLWLADVPRGAECDCVAWRERDAEGVPEDDDEWLSVTRPELDAPPQPPAALEPWLRLDTLGDSHREEPELREETRLPARDGSGDELRRLDQQPSVHGLFAWYSKNRWRPWAAEHLRLSEVQRVYSDLFTVRQRQQRLGEEYEVVLALGLLTWLTPSGHEVRRHLLTAQASLELDVTNGRIVVGPGGDGARPTLEQDMLDPSDRPAPDVVAALETELEAIGDGVWDPEPVRECLRRWIFAVSPGGRYGSALRPEGGSASAELLVELAPALVLRRRTERSLLRMFGGILDQLEEGVAVPFGLRRFVTVIEDETDEAERESDLPPVDTPLLPLEANDEQREIVDRLGERQGVLVQGPPGTGKSHTIANLICHLLASGKRVLVTSHAARALEVLRDMLPPGIRQLCVDLLGANRDALRTLEDSVQIITEKNKGFRPKESRALIAELETGLRTSRLREAGIARKLRALQERASQPHELNFGGYSGTLQAIARRLHEERERFAWLEDRPKEDSRPPLAAHDLAELAELSTEIAGYAREDLQCVWPRPASLPDGDGFPALCRREVALAAADKKAEPARSHPDYAAIAAAQPDDRERLTSGLTKILDGVDLLGRHVQPWAKDAALAILAEQDRVWRERLQATRRDLGVIEPVMLWVDRARITGLEDRDLAVVRADAQGLLEHFDRGGGLGFWIFRKAAVKRARYLVREVRVDGRECADRNTVAMLLSWIDVGDRMDHLAELWDGVVDAPKGSVGLRVGTYRDLCEPLEAAVDLHDELTQLRRVVERIEGLNEPTWHDLDGLSELREALRAASAAAVLDAAREEISALARRLRSGDGQANVHPTSLELAQAVDGRDPDAYAYAYARLCGSEQRRLKIVRRNELVDSLAERAPKLAATLRDHGTEPEWIGRLPELDDAWNHARTRAFVEARVDPTVEIARRRELRAQRDRTRKLTAELCEARAWHECFRRLTEHERQHLVAWTKAVRRIGKGTGKYAGRHRQAAREHMAECRSAIPAWIMPVYRVAETINAGTDAFDVVIVDEASQSGPEALFLLYLTKKIVIVGDDKQISPDNVGIEREHVEHLRQRHLGDLPHSDAFGLEQSLFDLADIRYGSRIRLHEHFRCMPEIIRFCNELCYASEPLVPLKQFGAGRLAPVIVTQFVESGRREGAGTQRVVNPQEAAALVYRIELCCADPAYAGKTFGVISLQGPHQAALIESMLIEQLGPEEVLARHLVCGDAYAFQGDERDVMFLSLVAAPDAKRRIGTLADQRSERRFNVAISRAKEQLWLFHSALPEHLSPKCLRYRLLEYCLGPGVNTPDAAPELDTEAVRAIAEQTDRAQTGPPAQFDSWLEVDVYLAITARGYRVRPNYDIAGYRIDLVVEGDRRRLAVECDGDEWDGPDAFDRDFARQKQLERCGWTFVRIRGSRFYLDRDGALEELWRTLDEQGIRGAGASERAGDDSP